MLITIAIVATWLVTMPIITATYLRFKVSPKMPSGENGYSKTWQGENGKAYKMKLTTGKIVEA